MIMLNRTAMVFSDLLTRRVAVALQRPVRLVAMSRIGRKMMRNIWCRCDQNTPNQPELYLARDLSTRWVAIGARAPFAAVDAELSARGRNGLTDHPAEETASESDEANPRSAGL